MSVERGEGRPDEYLFEGKPVVSVTTVLPDRGDRDGLLTWAGREAIKAALRAGITEADVKSESRRFRATARAHVDTRQTAADQGTQVHEAIQAHIMGDEAGVRRAIWEAPDGEAAEVCLEAYRAWEDDLGACIRWTAIELPLITKHLAGTPDMWGILTHPDGKETPILGDIKSGKYVGKKVGKQLGLYRWLLRKVRGIEITDAVILHFHAGRDRHGRLKKKAIAPRFGGGELDQYERAGLKELRAYYEDAKCPVLPGMWA